MSTSEHNFNNLGINLQPYASFIIGKETILSSSFSDLSFPPMNIQGGGKMCSELSEMACTWICSFLNGRNGNCYPGHLFLSLLVSVDDQT